MDIRCPHRKFGEITRSGDAQIEVSCPSRWCGKASGVVVIHLFSMQSGRLIKTTLYRDPRKE